MIIAKNLTKQYVACAENIKSIIFKNTITDTTTEVRQPQEFEISYSRNSQHIKLEKFGSSDCILETFSETLMTFSYCNYDIAWKITLTNFEEKGYIKTKISIDCQDKQVFIDSVSFMRMPIDNSYYVWSRPVSKEISTIPRYWASLGQPVYYKDMFFGIEDMCADNQVSKDNLSMKYYYGETVEQLGGEFTPPAYVVGGSAGDNMIDCQNAFFDYVSTFARPNRFRIQFNSWYDNWLDITPDNLKQSFETIDAKFKESGLRTLDCFVVDDGWVDYKKKEFWAFNSKFPNGFENESKLVKSFGSKFGVWFGPIGGYSESKSYAKNLESLGYFSNNHRGQICVGDPKYVDALIDKMIEFVKKYDVDYYKIDGFAIVPCSGKNHNHPVGGYKDLYFYSYQWRLWLKGFEKLRQASPNIFLNITSHSNCSAWLLKQADSVWINNSYDMFFCGKGSNLDQCLNYRDGRYYNFTKVRQLQFPLAYIYNHEPCYADRNYNPPLSKNKVVYTDAEFEKYLYMCMMRGTGFIELYYSPSMMTQGMYAANAKILKWAECNFNIIKNVKYFGQEPKNKCVYGYIGFDKQNGLVAIRNSSNKAMPFSLNLKQYSGIDTKPKIQIVYGNMDGIKMDGIELSGTIQPYEMKILSVKYDK